MRTVLMSIAVISADDKILLRKTDPTKNLYQEPWALFGGRHDEDLDVETSMNKEFSERWNMRVKIVERLFWDEDQKVDRDGEAKRFIYLDCLCELASDNEPTPVNPNEKLEWVKISDLEKYELNPPTKILLLKMNLI